MTTWDLQDQVTYCVRGWFFQYGPIFGTVGGFSAGTGAIFGVDGGFSAGTGAIFERVGDFFERVGDFSAGGRYFLPGDIFYWAIFSTVRYFLLGDIFYWAILSTGRYYLLGDIIDGKHYYLGWAILQGVDA